MVGTILPIGYGERQRHEWPIANSLHVMSYVIGALAAGALLGALGAVVHRREMASLSVTILAVAAAIACLREVGLINVPLPEFRRQVPGSLRLFMPPRLLAITYGLELGAGLTTFISTSAFYVVLLGVVLLGSPIIGALTMLPYAVGRAMPFVLLAIRTHDATQSALFLRRLTPLHPVVKLLNGALLAVIAAAFLTLTLLHAYAQAGTG